MIDIYIHIFKYIIYNTVNNVQFTERHGAAVAIGIGNNFPVRAISLRARALSFVLRAAL